MENQIKTIKINEISLPVREYQDQKVVTLKDISNVHGCAITNLRSNFTNHKHRFIEGEDYFRLVGKSVIKNFDDGLKATVINIFTESGYLMLAKSLNDDTSWKVQRELVNSYFKLQKVKNMIKVPTNFADALRLAADQQDKINVQSKVIEFQSKRIEHDQPKVELADKLISANNNLSVSAVAKSFGYGPNRFFQLLRKHHILRSDQSNWNLPMQQYLDRGYFKVVYAIKTIHHKTVDLPTTLVTAKGVSFIGKLVSSLEQDNSTDLTQTG